MTSNPWLEADIFGTDENPRATPDPPNYPECLVIPTPRPRSAASLHSNQSIFSNPYRPPSSDDDSGPQTPGTDISLTEAGRDIPAPDIGHDILPLESPEHLFSIGKMAESNTAAKKSGHSDGKYDLENVLPLLLATLGNPTVNNKMMAAMDPHKRSEYAWQHRFRDWKKAAREIMENNPDVAASVHSWSAPGSAKAPRTPKKSVSNTADGDDEGNEVTPKLTQSKKRPAPDTPDDTPTKRKKGTAQKKPPPKKVWGPEDKLEGFVVKSEEASEEGGLVRRGRDV